MDPLVDRARAGDRAALELLLARLAPAIHRFGMRMCRNPDDADDVLQDTLLNVATHLDGYEGRSSLTSWVFALTRSACARRRRGLKNKPPLPDDAAPEAVSGAPSPETQAEHAELTRALAGALDRLSDDHREVILLRDVEGLSAPEAADALGLSVDALKSRLHRAREALRVALAPVLEPAVVSGAAPATGCPDAVALWSKKLEGDLSQSDCAAMERHILGCATCGRACNALKHALLACQRVATDDVPPEVQARVKAAVKAALGSAAFLGPAR